MHRTCHLLHLYSSIRCTVLVISCWVAYLMHLTYHHQLYSSIQLHCINAVSVRHSFSSIQLHWIGLCPNDIVSCHYYNRTIMTVITLCVKEKHISWQTIDFNQSWFLFCCLLLDIFRSDHFRIRQLVLWLVGDLSHVHHVKRRSTMACSSWIVVISSSFLLSYDFNSSWRNA